MALTRHLLRSSTSPNRISMAGIFDRKRFAVVKEDPNTCFIVAFVESFPMDVGKFKRLHT